MRRLDAGAWLIAATFAVASAQPIQDPGKHRAQRLSVWLLRDGPASRATATRLVAALGDRDTLTRHYAEESLLHLGDPILEPLLSLAQDPPADLPFGEVAFALSLFGSAAAPALPTMMDHLEHDASRAEQLRLSAALGRVGGQALPGLLALIERRPELSEVVLRAIGAIGHDAAPAVPLLLRILRGDEDARHRFNAAQALGQIGPPAAEAIPELIDALGSDDNSSVRAYSAEALGSIGARPDEVVPALLDALREKRTEPRVAASAVTALAALGPAALEPVIVASRGPNPLVREQAAAVLREMDTNDPRRISALITALDDADPDVQRAAALALELIGEPALTAVTGAVATATSSRVRGYAVLVLGQMEPPLIAAVPALQTALRDPVIRVRQLAAWSLGKLGPDALAALDPLRETLDSDDALLRRNAAWALGNIGPRAMPAEAALERLAREDADDSVRAEAQEALQKLHGTYVFPGES